MKEFFNHLIPKMDKLKNLTTDHTDYTDKRKKMKAKVRVVSVEESACAGEAGRRLVVSLIVRA
ncbi:hypothetical protein FACS189485_23570 [Spirochaetia bacterium]|nr:hypothetical protein FACS189485_23570 [Spirochaetia bacterium]